MKNDALKPEEITELDRKGWWWLKWYFATLGCAVLLFVVSMIFDVFGTVMPFYLFLIGLCIVFLSRGNYLSNKAMAARRVMMAELQRKIHDALAQDKW